MRNVAAVLDDVIALYARPGTWRGGAIPARDVDGKPVPVFSLEAAVWSLEGALERAIGPYDQPDTWEATDELLTETMRVFRSAGVDPMASDTYAEEQRAVLAMVRFVRLHA